MKKLSREEFEAIRSSGNFERAMNALEQFTVRQPAGGRPRTATPEKRRADTRERVRRFREKKSAEM